MIEVPYQPIPVHVPFHKSSAYERHMFGAFGSGKTYAICAEAVAWCLEQPGIRGLITRKTIPELRDTTETVFFDVLPDELFKAGEATRIGGHYADFTFPNGSKVLFRSIDDWKKHKSLNLGFIAWDEMDEFDEETYQGMLSRIRQRDPTKEGRQWGAKEITRRGTWGASNPEGRNWIWKRFAKEPHERREFFRSTSFDNPYLTPDYYENLLAFPVPWIRRYVLCQFDDFGGQTYKDWSWERHVVKRYDVDALSRTPVYPPHAQHWMGMDPGTENPTGGLWVVVERHPRPRIVAVAEYLESDLNARKHATSWRQIEARHGLKVTRRIADPNSINVRDRGSNQQLSDIYRRLGFRFELGPSHYGDRITALGTLIANGQFAVTEDCPQTFEAIREARWKDITPAQRTRGEDPREVPLKKQRELVDCAEYLTGRWVAPVIRQDAIPDDRPDWMQEVQEALRAKVQRLGTPDRPTVEGIPV